MKKKIIAMPATLKCLASSTNEKDKKGSDFMKKNIISILSAVAVLGNTLAVSPITAMTVTSSNRIESSSDTDYSVLDKAYSMLKQFITEQKEKGNSAFSLTNVYSQEELTDGSGNIPEAFKDKVVVEYYYSDKEEFLKAVNEFMKNNNIDESLVFIVELQDFVENNDYTFEEKTNSDEFMMGDVNNDGAFNVSDVVLLQKWLLAVPDTHLANWKAVDFCEDNKLDVFDLTLMKRALIYDGIAQSKIDLKTQFPEYYGLPTTKGLEVYLWQETEGIYKCGLLMGTNRNKTDEEIIGLTHNGATVDQMKEILSSYNIDKNMIAIIPVQVSATSYEIVESDIVSVEIMFWDNSSDEPLSIDGKTFVNEKDGIGGQFTISFNKDGTYSYYEGSLSSYAGGGTWTISDDMVILVESTSGKKNKLRADGKDLVYIADGSDNFYYIHVKDGEKFTESSTVEQASSQIKSLSADDITNVTLSAYPPEKSVNLTKDQINDLLILLYAVSLYEEDNSYNEYGGQWVQFDITLNSGEKISLAAFSPFFIINRNGYRAEYETCHALHVFANSLIAE